MGTIRKEFLKYVQKSGYDYLYTEWGKRNEENDPTSFLENNGFQITKDEYGGFSATLKIQKVSRNF